MLDYSKSTIKSIILINFLPDPNLTDSTCTSPYFSSLPLNLYVVSSRICLSTFFAFRCRRGREWSCYRSVSHMIKIDHNMVEGPYDLLLGTFNTLKYVSLMICCCFQLFSISPQQKSTWHTFKKKNAEPPFQTTLLIPAPFLP